MVRAPRKVTLADLHRLLVKRLIHSAEAAYETRMRKARPRTISMRYTIDRILRVLVTGMQWRHLDTTEGCWQLHYQRFQQLADWGVFREEFEQAGRDYVARTGSIARVLIDGSHVKARHGGQQVGRSPVDRGKSGSKITVLTDQDSIPLCATFCAGNVSDVTQLSSCLEQAKTQYGDLGQFSELLADKGYDSMANRECCRKHGINPLILERNHRGPRKPRARTSAQQVVRRPTRQDSIRPQRIPKISPEEVRRTNQYRWAVERCFAWQDNYRRVTLRYERRTSTFQGMQFLSLAAQVCKRLTRIGVEE